MILTACGTVAGSGVDAASLDASLDSPLDSPRPRCNLAAPFGAPTLIAGINTTAIEGQGHLSSDRLTLYFVSDRAGGPGAEDLYVATRASETATFGTPMVIANVNSASFEEGAVISADGLTLYFSSARGNGTTHELFVANRTTVAGAFSAPTLLLNVNSTGQDLPTHVNAAQTALYIQSDRSGNYEIYRATRATTTQAFDAPVAVAALNDPAASDGSAVLTDDELTVYFWSTRAGGAGGPDVYKATRSTFNDGFGTPTRVTELNTASLDVPSWISPDGCDILLESDRAGGAGKYDMWISSKPTT
jgi:Tol biopolymer transport system component